jgi:hypothetical protein
MRWAYSTVFALGCCLSPACRTPQGSQVKQETDDRLTDANKRLVDVSKQINDLFRQKITLARQEVNPQAAPWTDELKGKLIEKVADHLAKLLPGSGIGIHWNEINLEISQVSAIEDLVFRSLDESKNEIHSTKFVDSRYGDNPIGLPWAKVMSHVSMETADHSISPAIRLGRVIVGTDKLGHFAEEGHWLFLAEKRGLLHGPSDRFQFGQFMEGDPALSLSLYAHYSVVFGTFCPACVIWGGFGYYGMVATGVCSFGDIASNEGGYTFYSDLYAHPADYVFDILSFDTKSWSEEVSKSKYLPGLLVRPSPSDVAADAK